MLTPTPEQEKAIQRIVAEPTRAAIQGSELGVGKTLMAVETIKRLNNNLNLVTAPLHTRDGWERTFDTQSAGELRVVDKSKAGKLAFSDLMFGVPGNYFVGRELARLQDWTHVPVGTFVADECHSLVNPRSRGFKAYASPGTYGKQTQSMSADFRLFQSATWFGASFEGAWAIARLLWPHLNGHGQVADQVQFSWKDFWCAKESKEIWVKDENLVRRLKYSDPTSIIEEQVSKAGGKRWLVRLDNVVGEREPGKFVTDAPCYVKIKNDLPPVEHIEIRYQLSNVQKRLYREMEAQGLAWLRDNPLAVELPVVQRIRLRDITLAEPILLDDGSVDYAPDSKSALFEVMSDLLGDLIGEQVLMGTHSAKFAKYVANCMGSAFAWAGQVSERELADAKERFVRGALPVIVATQAKIGEGTDGLQHAAHVMFELSLNDNPILNEQFRGRLRRPGQARPVVCYRFVAEGSLDDSQHESLLGKELAMRASVM